MPKTTHLPLKASPAFIMRLQNGRFLFFLKITACRFERRLEVSAVSGLTYPMKTVTEKATFQNALSGENMLKTISSTRVWRKDYGNFRKRWHNGIWSQVGEKWFLHRHISSYKTTENVNFVLLLCPGKCSISFSRIWLLVPMVRVRW